MEFLLGNPYSTPVGQCIGELAAYCSLMKHVLITVNGPCSSIVCFKMLEMGVVSYRSVNSHHY